MISRDKVKDALLRLVQVCSTSKITICNAHHVKFICF
jgi:hypothetical protein